MIKSPPIKMIAVTLKVVVIVIPNSSFLEMLSEGVRDVQLKRSHIPGIFRKVGWQELKY